MRFKLEASKRTVGKKSLNHQLRNEGRIPAVIYGQGEAGIPISLDRAVFTKEYKKSIGELAFFSINLDGKEFNTVIKEKQIHPVRRDVIHVDFLELHKDTPIHVEVPIKFIGQPHSLKEGGILEVGMRHLAVSCLPADVPEDIELNIEDLKIGQSIHVKDLNVGKMHVREAADVTVVSVHGQRGKEKPVEAEAVKPEAE